ncbi:hypothetical protein AAL_00022 [Moelleriella libera RCEF 2490]|uniref:HFB protein n=1 Tax=Moelleriella libera RCEF 2490 TaxID=1081109 RepID=A0A166UHV2_9HYPO|nr:hypothetical protein AAL_00022 [Moelleriella libera RCEF 2490]
MRFSLAIVSGLAAIASAQSTTSSADPAASSEVACLKKCRVDDVDCQAHCITVPSPNEQQVNDTTKCARECPQGNGSPAETDKYASCVQACIQKHYYVSSAGTPQATGGSNGGAAGSNGSSGSSGSSGAAATATNSGAAPSKSAASKSSGSAASQTASGAAATTTNAAPGLTFGSSTALVGFFAALFAL